jgi:hypothetical protein
VKILLDIGTKTNVKDQSRMTALGWSAEKSHTEVVELLKQVETSARRKRILLVWP